MLGRLKLLPGKIRLPDYSRVDDVTSIHTAGRDHYKYMEEGRVLYIGMDRMPGNPSRRIYSSTIRKWRPPHENEEMTAEDKARILSKFCRWLEEGGQTYEIV